MVFAFAGLGSGRENSSLSRTFNHSPNARRRPSLGWCVDWNEDVGALCERVFVSVSMFTSPCL